jgi:hypothetical protein
MGEERKDDFEWGFQNTDTPLREGINVGLMIN